MLSPPRQSRGPLALGLGALVQAGPEPVLPGVGVSPPGPGSSDDVAGTCSDFLQVCGGGGEGGRARH